MVNCVILGALGYTGIELTRILLRHSYVRIAALSDLQGEGTRVQQLIPALPRNIDLEVRNHSFAELKRAADIVFLCLPHTQAMLIAKKYREAGKIVIDFSADYRLTNAQEYEAWYGVRHQCRPLLKEAVYGMPELFREKVRKADLIANPGCYPTGVILACTPLLRKKLIRPDDIVINAASGVSGAGKRLNPNTQYFELSENFYGYRVGKHQHTPEISQFLGRAAGKPLRVTFVPHLLPIKRGILSTIYLRRRKGVKREAIRRTLERAYEGEPFVRVLADGVFPNIKAVRETNYCDIGVWADEASERVVVLTAIDNLLKGASGQAAQNMNVRMGFPEDEGLRTW